MIDMYKNVRSFRPRVLDLFPHKRHAFPFFKSCIPNALSFQEFATIIFLVQLIAINHTVHLLRIVHRMPSWFCWSARSGRSRRSSWSNGFARDSRSRWAERRSRKKRKSRFHGNFRSAWSQRTSRNARQSRKVWTSGTSRAPR